MKLTIFSACWPCTMEDHFLARQDNCFGSWENLEPQPEIILCGDELGLAETAEKRGYIHIPDVEYLHGVPLMSSMFEKVLERATGDLVCSCLCDNMLMQDFMAALEVIANEFERFVMVGCRTSFDYRKRIVFKPGWQGPIRDLWRRYGVLKGGGAGLDCIAFRREHPIGLDMPPLCMSAHSWDNWVMDDALRRGFDGVDVTRAVQLYHQHDHENYQDGGRSGRNEYNHALILAWLKEQGRAWKDLRGWVGHAQWRMENDLSIRKKGR